MIFPSIIILFMILCTIDINTLLSALAILHIDTWKWSCDYSTLIFAHLTLTKTFENAMNKYQTVEYHYKYL